MLSNISQTLNLFILAHFMSDNSSHTNAESHSIYTLTLPLVTANWPSRASPQLILSPVFIALNSLLSFARTAHMYVSSLWSVIQGRIVLLRTRL